jgi:ABC-type amino acid transport system permease subunit
MLAAGFGALGAVIYAITALSQANLLAGLVLAPVAFFQQIGVIVLILRARR